MKRLALLLFIACSSPVEPVTDSGTPDSGPPQPQPGCVPSACTPIAGRWRVVYDGDAGNIVCQPVENRLTYTADGGSVCMLKADEGTTDGGCNFAFTVHNPAMNGLTITDSYQVTLTDAGHIYGFWSTSVSGSVSCTAEYALHAQP